MEAYKKIFSDHGVHLSTYFIQFDYESGQTEINFVVLAPSHRNYMPLFNDLRKVNDTASLTLTNQY